MAAVATGVEERLLIGGEWVEAGDGGRFDVTDPGTGEIVGSVPNAGESDVAAAIDAAAAALDEWKAQPALNRARILRRAADLIRERRDRIVSIDFSGPGTAFAKVECQLPPRYFTDYLTLLKADGRWQVISKSFHTVTKDK